VYSLFPNSYLASWTTLVLRIFQEFILEKWGLKNKVFVEAWGYLQCCDLLSRFQTDRTQLHRSVLRRAVSSWAAWRVSSRLIEWLRGSAGRRRRVPQSADGCVIARLSNLQLKWHSPRQRLSLFSQFCTFSIRCTGLLCQRMMGTSFF